MQDETREGSGVERTADNVFFSSVFGFSGCLTFLFVSTSKVRLYPRPELSRAPRVAPFFAERDRAVKRSAVAAGLKRQPPSRAPLGGRCALKSTWRAGKKTRLRAPPLLTLDLFFSLPPPLSLSRSLNYSSLPPVARPKLTTIMISASIARPRVVAVRASKEAGASAKAVAAPALKAASVIDRRAALSMIAGVAAVVAAPSESKAAYGEAANVFGKVRTGVGVAVQLAEAAERNWERDRAFPREKEGGR